MTHFIPPKHPTHAKLHRVVVGLASGALILAAMAALVLGGANVRAQEADAAPFPSRMVRILVPFSPGGTTDLVARKLANILQSEWKQPVIIENRPGAGTIIATRAVATAAPDGYTILLTDFALATNDLLYKKLPYNSKTQLSPITTIAAWPLGIVITKSINAYSLGELVTISKEKQLNYGSFGQGTSPQLVMELFKSITGAKIEHIPYQGVSQVQLALTGDEIQVMVTGAGAIVPNVKAGTVRALAFDEETSLLPGVPTYAKAGFPGMRSPAWWGMVAPGDTPAPIIEKINRAIAVALEDADLRKFLVENGYTPVGDSPRDFAARIQDTKDLWGPIIKSVGISLSQ